MEKVYPSDQTGKPERMKQTNRLKRKGIRWFTLLRAAGIIIFIVVLFNVDLKGIWENIRTISPIYFLLGILSQVALLLIKGWRWHILNKGANQHKKPARSMGEFLESYAFGVFTPGRIGELMKAGYQQDRTGILASGFRVIAERGMDVGIFTIIAGTALGKQNLFSFSETISILITISGATIFLISLLIIGNKKVTTLVTRLIKKHSLEGFHLSTDQSFMVLILTLFSNAFAFVSCFFLAMGIQMKVSFLSLSGGVAIAGLFNMLPITVMGLGTREITFLYVFQNFPETQVMALSALVFIVAQVGGALLAMLMGQAFLYMHRTTKK